MKISLIATGKTWTEPCCLKFLRSFCSYDSWIHHTICAGCATRGYIRGSVRVARLVYTLHDPYILGDPGLPVVFKSGRESPRGNCLTRPVPNGRSRSCDEIISRDCQGFSQSIYEKFRKKPELFTPSKACSDGPNQYGDQLNFIHISVLKHMIGIKAYFTQIGQKNTNIIRYQSEARTTATLWKWPVKIMSSGAPPPLIVIDSQHPGLRGCDPYGLYESKNPSWPEKHPSSEVSYSIYG